MPVSYLVRYGLMGHVGPFASESDAFERGQAVVVASRRGLEVGEILAPASVGASNGSSGRVVRVAGPGDRAGVEQRRAECLAACDHVFGEGVWPLAVIDAEPLLDGRRAVVYYLGPHQLDTSGLCQSFRDRFDLEVLFEPVGRDEPAEAEAGCGSSCGGGGCGEGGCGSGGGGHASSGGCDGCAVKDLVGRRRVPAVAD